MNNLSITEENYLKAIYSAHMESDGPVSTTTISKTMDIAPASVSDMLKKLKEKGLIDYQKYYGASLSEVGHRIAGQLIRRHRLWEVFLVEKLGFSWDEVHIVAEQLEHINSPHLTDRLDAFLGHPRVDPHGEAIPDKDGQIIAREGILLSEMAAGQSGHLIKVLDDSSLFLKTLNNYNIELGSILKCLSKNEYDQSILLEINETQITLSDKMAGQLLMQ